MEGGLARAGCVLLKYGDKNILTWEYADDINKKSLWLCVVSGTVL